MSSLLITILITAGSVPTLISIWNLIKGSGLIASGTNNSAAEEKVSVLIPARNEEKNISVIIDALKNQSYKSLEVIIIDDNSADSTFEIAEKKIGTDERFRIIKGFDPEAGWLGKNFACNRLAAESSGRYLLFMDADVIPAPDAVKNAINTLMLTGKDALSVFPSQINITFGEKIIVPLMKWFLLSFLPLSLAGNSKSEHLTAANGQFMLFKRESYMNSGGHKAVRDCVVEDMQIARNLKKNGFTISVYTGGSDVFCRMYPDFNEAMEGFTKNFFAGFNKNIFVFAAMHLYVFAVNIGFILLSVLTGYIVFLLPVFLNRLSVSLITKESIILNILLAPLHSFVFLFTGFRSYIYTKKGIGKWKGRDIHFG